MADIYKSDSGYSEMVGVFETAHSTSYSGKWGKVYKGSTEVGQCESQSTTGYSARWGKVYKDSNEVGKWENESTTGYSAKWHKIYDVFGQEVGRYECASSTSYSVKWGKVYKGNNPHSLQEVGVIKNAKDDDEALQTAAAALLLGLLD